MGPPRLTVVERSEPDADADAAAPFAADVAAPANDAAPTDEAPLSGSPVHDLIQTIAEGAVVSMPTEEAPQVVVEAAPNAATGTQPAEARDAPLDPERREKLRILEAVIFAAAEPQDEARLATYLKAGDDVAALLAELRATYAGRGVQLVRVAGKWAFRTAEDLSWVLERHARQERRLSKAALETLAIVAYHQPVTRAEIEEVRGVSISKGTLDVLMEAGWVRPRGRRRAPGKPITYGTTEQFLEHFGLEAVKDLPGLSDLKAAGLLDANLPPDFKMPEPTDAAALMPDELPLEEGGDGDEPLQVELELDEPLADETDTPDATEQATDDADAPEPDRS
jgi:segregation and condensation protein B